MKRKPKPLGIGFPSPEGAAMLGKLEKFFKYCGIEHVKLRADEAYSDDHVAFIVNMEYIVGYHISTKSYFLQTIKQLPGDRETPPDEDYIDVIESGQFEEVMLELLRLEGKAALEIMGDEQWEATS